PLGVLLWNLDAERSERRLLPDESALVMTCRSTALISVGKTNSQDYQLKVDLHKNSGDGEFGLILGFKKHDATDQKRFQAIVVKMISTGPFSKRCSITRRRYLLKSSGPGRAHESYEPLAEVEVSPPGFEVAELEIRMVAGRLASVSWNREDLSALADPPEQDSPAESSTGEIGLLNAVGRTRFENLSFRNNQRK
ncbi:MAG: hypothetical protein ABGZ17_13675, partial [Planctomycetaceae bacterium]